MGISFISKLSLGWKLLFGNVELEELNRAPGSNIGLGVEVRIYTSYVMCLPHPEC